MPVYKIIKHRTNQTANHLSLQTMLRTCLIIFCMLGAAIPAFSQQKAADKIIAIIGNKIILQSELGTHIYMQKRDNPNISDSAICDIFHNMLAEKLLVEQAIRDSVIVDDAAVEGELDNRLRGYMADYGSKERMEEVLGKTIYQIKDENRQVIKDQLTAQKEQMTVMENVKITPEEVKVFFNTIPDAEKPLLPATVEMGQIVVKPDVDPELDKYAKDQLETIRKDIVENGKDFAVMAGIYSQDPGSKNTGGEYKINRSGFDPAFVSAAYRLQPGEISPVIKSRFGYHIIKMEKRMGEEAIVKHILIRPEITSIDIQKTLAKLDTIKNNLDSGKITFQTAVAKYSTDDNSKMTGGMVYDPQSGGTLLPIEQLDPQMALEVEKLKIGQFSTPQVFTDPQTGDKSCRILYLKSRTDPHKANLKDDYNQIQSFALGKKKNEHLMKWIAEKLPTYYIKLDPAYKNCDLLKEWYKNSDKVASN